MKFNVGDLLKFKKGSWWLVRSGGFRNEGKAYSPDSLVLVTKFDNSSGTGFFYGRICSTGEERLWNDGEFELASKSC